MTNAEFSEAVAKFMLALRRRVSELTYLLVREWRNGVQHAHALLRVRRLTRTAMRASREVAGVRCSAARVRDVDRVASYVFKETKRIEKKAELAPANFRGRMYTVSRGFLTKSFTKLWRELQDARRAAKEAAEKPGDTAPVFPETRPDEVAAGAAPMFPRHDSPIGLPAHDPQPEPPRRHDPTTQSNHDRLPHTSPSGSDRSASPDS